MLKKIAASVLALTMLFGSGVMPKVNMLPDTAVTASADKIISRDDVKARILFTNAAGKEYEVEATKDDNLKFDVDIDTLKEAMGGDLKDVVYTYTLFVEAEDDEYNYCYIPSAPNTTDCRFFRSDGSYIDPGIYAFDEVKIKLYREGSEFVKYFKGSYAIAMDYFGDEAEAKIFTVSYSIGKDDIKLGKTYYHDVFEDLDVKLTYTNAAGKTASFEGECGVSWSVDGELWWGFDIDPEKLKAEMDGDLDGLQYTVDISAKALKKEYSGIAFGDGARISSDVIVAYGDHKSLHADTIEKFDISGKALENKGTEYKNDYVFESKVAEQLAKYADYDGYIVDHFYISVSIDPDKIVPVELADTDDSKGDSSSTKPDDGSSKPDSDSSSKPDDTSSRPDTKPTKVLGNVNGDDNIDVEDVVTIINSINGVNALTPEQEKVADVDGSGVVDIEDAVAIINHINGVSTLTD